MVLYLDVYKFFESLRRLHHLPTSIEQVQSLRVRKSVFMLLTIILGQAISHVLMLAHFVNGLSLLLAYSLINFYFLIVLVTGYFFLPYRMRIFGFNLNMWKFNLLWGSIIGLCICVPSVLYRIHVLEVRFVFTPWDLLYPIFSYSQEGVARGFFQSYLIAVIGQKKKNKLPSIILTALLFSSMHAVGGYSILILTFIFSLGAGLFYEKTRSILGVFVIHLIGGGGLLLMNGY